MPPDSLCLLHATQMMQSRVLCYETCTGTLGLVEIELVVVDKQLL